MQHAAKDRDSNRSWLRTWQDLSDEQLRDVAQTLGQEWERAALHLGLKKKDLDEIKKEDKVEFMQRRNMLQLWKKRRTGKTTARALLRGLEDLKDLLVETHRLLKGLVKNGSKPAKKKPSYRSGQGSRPGQDLSDKQLRDVAQTLGQEWKRAALHLGLTKKDLDEIKKEDEAEFMQRRNMLLLWKKRRTGKTTAQDLLRGLKDLEDLPVETHRLLKGSNTETRSQSEPARQALTDKELLQVAKTLGQEWEEVAIHLELKNNDLEVIKAEHRSVAMQKQKMLVLWRGRRRPPGKAQDLLRGLKDMEDLPVGTRQLLTGMMKKSSK
ncbi:uncharacterized protein LOC130405769 isoform X2 [Gadus chalcogrammus]|uniref:uncharacterized protein LOC130405769 isoform X2 n=1 Tax=Gadus chalcogrammus TaxID=1042646 RepID=UPI0024C4E021|nr:uncharacterized protein LOC130405769 isoform X2 [Gadus chalcogrammus]